MTPQSQRRMDLQSHIGKTSRSWFAFYSRAFDQGDDIDTTQRSIDLPSQFLAGYSPEIIIKRVESMVIEDSGFSVGGGHDDGI